MSSTISRKIKTASRILVTQGPRALMTSIVRELRSAPVDRYAPNEAEIIYDVLSNVLTDGVMVDVGAHHGGTLRRFAQAGWRVFAFEPDSENRRRLLHYGFDKMSNVIIDGRCVSDKPAKNVPFFRSEESTGISGLSAFHPTHFQDGNIDVTTLDLFAREQAIDRIDFLKIDTEGYDLFVLRGLPWQRIQPAVILCEFEDRKTIPLGYSFQDLAEFLSENGYQLIVSEWYPIERYGVKHDWRRFSTYPCQLEDPKAWGNVIAAKGSLADGLRRACGLVGTAEDGA